MEGKKTEDSSEQRKLKVTQDEIEEFRSFQKFRELKTIEGKASIIPLMGISSNVNNTNGANLVERNEMKDNSTKASILVQRRLFLEDDSPELFLFCSQEQEYRAGDSYRSIPLCILTKEIISLNKLEILYTKNDIASNYSLPIHLRLYVIKRFSAEKHRNKLNYFKSTILNVYQEGLLIVCHENRCRCRLLIRYEGRNESIDDGESDDDSKHTEIIKEHDDDDDGCTEHNLNNSTKQVSKAEEELFNRSKKYAGAPNYVLC